LAPCSLQTVISLLGTIWEHVFTERLNIDLKELKNCYVILIIPEQFEPSDVREMLNLLFNYFKVEAAALIQESVAASYGAGLSSACIVDIGHQRTTIACIDDGIVIPQSRISLNYGGQDISRVLLWLLREPSNRKHYFPYSSCNILRARDEEIINLMKESLCHLRKSILLETFEFKVRNPGEPTKWFTMNVSDALVIAPMALFFPDLLLLHMLSSPSRKKRSLIEDVYDEESLSNNETFHASGKNSKAEDLGSNVSISSKKNKKIRPPLSIDKAVYQSIKAVERSEVRKKLFGSILLVGGSSQFDSLPDRLEDKLFEHIPPLSDVERVEVFNSRRDIDPRFVSWKGGAILSFLEGVEELWITRKEWERGGIRTLKEKISFAWNP